VSKQFVWGVDVSTKRLAFGFSNGDTTTLSLAVEEGSRRLSEAHSAISQRSAELAGSYPPFCVFVEEPMGKFHNRSLDNMAAITQAAIYSALETRYPYPVSVLTIPPPQWKSTIGIPGNASKEEVMAWARSVGYSGDSQDEADALAIAYAGERMTAAAA